MPRWSDRLNALRRLSPAERRLLAPLAMRLATAAVAVRLLPLRLLLRWAQCRLGGTPRPPVDASRLAELARSLAARLLPPGSCLPQALALCRTLRRRGIPARVRLGVARNAERFAAHAWVEVDGRPLDPLATAHHPLPPLPP